MSLACLSDVILKVVLWQIKYSRSRVGVLFGTLLSKFARLAEEWIMEYPAEYGALGKKNAVMVTSR